MPRKADCGIFCDFCGKPVYPLVCQQMPDDARVVLKGQWMWSPELGATIFVLDQDTEIAIIDTRGNGQLAIVTDEGEGPTQHVHDDCYERMAKGETFEFYQEDEEDVFDFDQDPEEDMRG